MRNVKKTKCEACNTVGGKWISARQKINGVTTFKRRWTMCYTCSGSGYSFIFDYSEDVEDIKNMEDKFNF